MSNLEFAKMLTISTAHVSRTTSEALDAEASNVPITYQKHDYGWFIYIPDPEDMPNGCPAELATVLEFARSHGAQWLVMDRDADELDELQSFNW